MRIVLGLLLLMMSIGAHADLITGELKFDGTPPTAAVLYVRNGQAAINQLQIDQKDRQFSQFMNAGSTGAVITFHNSDSARHNLYANSYATGTRFDVGLVPPGKSVTLNLSWPEDSIVRVGCAIHTHMETYIANIRSSNYQVLPFKRWEAKRSGGLDDYDASAPANDEFEEKISNEIGVKLRSVPTELTSLTLLIPYFPAVNFELKSGESKTIDILRDGTKRGTLTIKRS
jgi:hypothetical protein